MKTKTQKIFSYEGLGFPIKLQDVTLVLVDDEWCPKVNVREVAEHMIKELPFQKERLTGSQVKFIRNYFSMSLRDFATKVVKESHTAVAKWEKLASKTTNMDINIEILLRLYIHERVSVKTMKQQQRFFEGYMLLRDMEFSTEQPVPMLLMLG